MATKKKLVAVKAGQIWEDLDPRLPHKRRGTIDAVVKGMAVMVWSPSGRRTTVRLDRLGKRYRLVK